MARPRVDSRLQNIEQGISEIKDKLCDISLDTVTPIKFGNVILIPIKSDIVKLFGANQVQFQISIKDKKIVIESPKILADLDIQDNTPGQEAINVK